MKKILLLLIIPVILTIFVITSFFHLKNSQTSAQTTTSLLWPGDPLNDKLCVGSNGASVKCGSNPNQTEVHDIAGTYIFIDYNGNKQIDEDELDIPNRTGKCFCGRRDLTINNTKYGGNMSYAYCNQVTFAQSQSQNFNVELYRLEKTNGQLVLKADFREQYQPTVVIAKRFRVSTNSNITDNLNGSVATTTVTSGNLTRINLNRPTVNSGRPTTWVVFFGIQPQNTNAGNVCANYDVCNVTNDNDANGANDVYKCTNIATNNVNVRVFIDGNRNGNRDIGENCYQGPINLTLDMRQSNNSSLMGGGTRQYNSSSNCATPIRLTYPRTGGVARLSLANNPSGYTSTGIDGNTNRFTLPANEPRTVIINANNNTNNINVEYGIYSSTTTPPTTYSISGSIYLDDSPANSTKDTGEDLIQGTINIQGSSVNQSVNSNTTSGYVISNLPAGNYTVSFTPPTTYTVSQPSNVTIPPPSYNITVGASCSTISPSTCLNGNVTNLNFGLRDNSAAGTSWFQTVGGDIRIDSNFNDNIPGGATCNNTTTPYVSSESTSLGLIRPGIVFSKSSTVNFGSGTPASKANVNRWLLLNNPYKYAAGKTIRSSYTYSNALLKRKGVSTRSMFGTNSICGATNGSCTFQSSATDGVYTYTGNVTISPGITYNFPANKKYVLLIDGDLNISRNFNVPSSSSIQFIVSGNINISDTVRNIDGIFSTDNNFTVMNSASGVDQDLVIEGSVIANAGNSNGKFNNFRDLGTNNSICPAVKIILRPDMVLSSPNYLKLPNFNYQEIAP